MVEEAKENKGIIEEILLSSGAKGDFYKLNIGGKTYNCFDNTDAFGQLSKKEFVKGELVGFDYSEHPGTSKSGQPITYKNLLKLIKVAQGIKVAQDLSFKGPQPTQITQITQNDMRETRIVRMNSLTNAIAFFELNHNANVIVQSMNVIELAAYFEAWINREKGM